MDDPSCSCIYAITNWITGDRYIGSAKSFRARKSKHLSMLRRGEHKNKHLQAAWNKYGEGSFGFGIVTKIALDSDLISSEQAWLDSYGPEYNISKTAGSTLGCAHSEETKKKISERKGKSMFWLGKKFSAEHRAKISLGKQAAPLSKEARERIGQAQRARPKIFGRKLSPESVKKMSNSKSSPIINFSTGEVFDSVRDAMSATGEPRNYLYHHIRRPSVCAGLQWAFLYTLIYPR